MPPKPRLLPVLPRRQRPWQPMPPAARLPLRFRVARPRADTVNLQQRPDRMDFGKMAVRRDRERLDHQMGAREMREQLVIIAVGDLDDELRHFPAPQFLGRRRGGEDREVGGILTALDRDRDQRGAARRHRRT